MWLRRGRDVVTADYRGSVYDVRGMWLWWSIMDVFKVIVFIGGVFMVEYRGMFTTEFMGCGYGAIEVWL